MLITPLAALIALGRVKPDCSNLSFLHFTLMVPQVYFNNLLHNRRPTPSPAKLWVLELTSSSSNTSSNGSGGIPYPLIANAKDYPSFSLSRFRLMAIVPLLA